MLNAKNFVSLTGGIVADPEKVSDTIVRFRMACDYSGYEKDNKDNKTGYFDVTYFLSNDNPNVKFVKSQLDAGNLRKGSQVSIIGSLTQDRWATEDGSKRQAVKINAESLTYAGSAPAKTDADGESTTSGPAPAPVASVPDQF
jgi:single-stranded DNA-binding protein